MEDNKNTQAGQGTPTDQAKGGTTGGNGTTTDTTTDTTKNGEGNGEGGDTKTFSQDDVNKIVSERIKRERESFEKNLTERLEKERAEAERLAKLSAAEKEQELRKKEAEKFEQQKREFTLKENRLEARIKLAELGLPNDDEILSVIVREDIDATQASIVTLKTYIEKAVEDGVKAKLAGKTIPKDPTGNNSDSVAKERKNYF